MEATISPPETPDSADAVEVDDRLAPRVAGLGCPNCGASMEVAPGVRVVTCPFCASRSLATGDRGTRRFAVEPRIDAEAARRALHRWLARGWSKDPKLRREAEMGEAFLCFLPFFRVEADAVGMALGVVRERRTVNGKTRTVEKDVERLVERHLDQTFAAVNVSEWGVSQVDLTGDPLVPYDGGALERQGMVFPPTVSETTVRRQALENFATQVDPASGLHRVRFRLLDTLRDRLSVIHYPLWIVRYRFKGRSYQGVIDGEDGSLSFGKAPGNDWFRALALVGSQALACFAITTGIQSDTGGFGWVLGGAIFLGAFRWGWRKFRYGAVVIEGTGAPPESKRFGWLRRMKR
ncbi:MAG: hypothetical protein AAF481_05300 [Acidobacteriota bacterium]